MQVNSTEKTNVAYRFLQENQCKTSDQLEREGFTAQKHRENHAEHAFKAERQYESESDETPKQTEHPSRSAPEYQSQYHYGKNKPSRRYAHIYKIDKNIFNHNIVLLGVLRLSIS